VSTSEPDIDGPDELRELIRNILGSVAGYERAVIRGRMMAGKAAKVASGGYGGGRPPFGSNPSESPGIAAHSAAQRYGR
jgi:DNA invertase Pin-like site-specific DNA recombinase